MNHGNITSFPPDRREKKKEPKIPPQAENSKDPTEKQMRSGRKNPLHITQSECIGVQHLIDRLRQANLYDENLMT